MHLVQRGLTLDRVNSFKVNKVLSSSDSPILVISLRIWFSLSLSLFLSHLHLFFKLCKAVYTVWFLFMTDVIIVGLGFRKRKRTINYLNFQGLVLVECGVFWFTQRKKKSRKTEPRNNWPTFLFIHSPLFFFFPSPNAGSGFMLTNFLLVCIQATNRFLRFLYFCDMFNCLCMQKNLVN